MQPILLVTAFFDLSRRENNAVRRNPEKYLKAAQFILSLKHPLVIYCDEDYVELIRKIRPDAQIVPSRLEDFEYFHYENQVRKIYESGRGNPQKFVPDKYTFRYCILTWTKFACLAHAIQNNSSEKVYWIDFGLPHLKEENPHFETHFEEFFLNPSEKIKLLQRFYVPKDKIDKPFIIDDNDLAFAGGFFGGQIENVLWFKEQFDQRIAHYISRDYAPLEEQIFAWIVSNSPERFDMSYGNYWEILNNLVLPTRNQRWVINAVMLRALQNKDLAVVRDVGKQLWEVRDKMSPSELVDFTNLYHQVDKSVIPRTVNLKFVFVTCYYDLRKRESAIGWISQRAKDGKPRRTPEEYIELAKYTLSLNVPMVIFTERAYLKKIQDIRNDPKCLRTKYIVRPLEDFETTKYIKKIQKIYEKGPMQELMKIWPAKLTPIYCQLTWTKLYMIEEVIRTKPFPMDRIIWIDFGLSYLRAENCRFGENFPSNLLNFPEKIKATQRTIIDPVQVGLPQFFTSSTFLVAATLFGGSIENMLWMKIQFEKEIQWLLGQNLAPLEEQIFSRMVALYPERFEVSYGNYGEVLDNLDGIRHNFNWCTTQFITMARTHNKPEIAFKIGQQLWDQRDRMGTKEFFMFLEEYYAFLFTYDKPRAISIVDELIRATPDDPEVRKRIETNLNMVGLTLNPPLKKVTFVTMFYDLTRRENNPTRRNPESYLTRQQRTLLRKYPMVIYTDPEYAEFIREIRKVVDPQFEMTEIIVKPMEEFRYQKHHDKLIQIWNEPWMVNGELRKEIPWKWSGTYTQLTWTKVGCLEDTINRNPFNTDRFAWMDFGLGYLVEQNPKFGEHLHDYLDHFTDKIKVTLRFYAANGVQNTKAWFSDGGFLIPGGFFGGSGESLRWFIDRFHEDVEKLIAEDIGPLEEQIFGRIYMANPEKFDVSYGNYWNILDNLDLPHQGHGWIVSWYMMRASDAGDHKASRTCGDQLWRVRSEMTVDDLRAFLEQYYISIYYTREENDSNLAEVALALAKSMEDCTDQELIKRVRKNLSYVGIKLPKKSS
jgi:hypothetical protein